MTLNLIRDIPEAMHLVREGDWQTNPLDAWEKPGFVYGDLTGCWSRGRKRTGWGNDSFGSVGVAGVAHQSQWTSRGFVQYESLCYGHTLFIYMLAYTGARQNTGPEKLIEWPACLIRGLISLLCQQSRAGQNE